MLKEKIEKFLSKKESKSEKRKIENIVVFIIILIITIIVINMIINTDEKNNVYDNQLIDANKKLASTTNQEDLNYQIQDNMVLELEEILSNISGVGNVKVMITYAQTSKTMPVYNEEGTQESTEETDSQGGTRKVNKTDTKKEIIYEETDDGKKLITQSIISPVVEGAIITAQGANNATVKANIIQAVGAVTGLATHKIQVFEMAK